MSGTRISRARLVYGCHERAFDLPAGERPAVVTGGNGSGKSTLLEGLVRTLYGFNRRTGQDGWAFEQRTPWNAEHYSGRVELECPTGRRTAIERDFSKTMVSVEPLDPVGEPWTGDGNPAASNLQARAFRDRLRELFGLDRFEDYGRTAYVQQGELVHTTLGGDLLRAAAGGTMDVDSARDAVRKLHRDLTQEPVVSGERRGVRARHREALAQRIDELRDLLEGAVTAQRRRDPLVDARRELEAELETRRSEIDQLEAAQQPLVERQTLAHGLGPRQERIRTLEALSEELSHARSGLQNALEARGVELGSRSPLPEDFPERAAALTELWETQRHQQDRRTRFAADLAEVSVPHRAVLIPGALLAAVGVAWIGGFATPHPWAGWLAVALGAGAIATAWGWRRARRHRHDERLSAVQDADAELSRSAQAIDQHRKGVVDGDDLTVDSVAMFRDRHGRQQRAHDRVCRAQATLDAVADRAKAALHDGDVLDDDDLSMETLQGILGDLISRQRNELVRCQRQLDEAEVRPLALPQGVDADLTSVRHGLSERRRIERELQERLRDTDRRLLEEGTVGRSPAALEGELTALETELGEVDDRIAACRAAWALIGDAHVQFRNEDEQRLVNAISEHLAAISDGRLGPLEAAGGLEQAMLRAFGRSVPLDYRPLSYGQYHLALLAIRLGAADFLTRSGIRVPLIIDEPFTNLDDTNAALVWRQLERVASDRQVIVATQECALLDRLGIQPDIRL